MAFRATTPAPKATPGKAALNRSLLGLAIAGAMAGAAGPAAAQYYLDEEDPYVAQEPYGYSYGYRERYIPARPIPQVTERDVARIATREFGLTRVERLVRTGASYVVDGPDLSGARRRLIFDARSGAFLNQVVLQPARPAAPQVARVAPREPQRATAPALIPQPPERPPELKAPAEASAPATAIPPSPAAPAPAAEPAPAPKDEPASAAAPATQQPETPVVPKPAVPMPAEPESKPEAGAAPDAKPVEEAKPAEAPKLVEPTPAEPREEPKPPVARGPEAPAIEAKPEATQPIPVKPEQPAGPALPPYAPTE